MIYVTSDLHGYPLAEFKKFLNKTGFCENDFCYILGDVIDRGYESIKLLKWIMKQPNMTLLRGNHEDMMLQCAFLFERDEARQNPDESQIKAYDNWISNGGRQTLRELKAYSDTEVLQLIGYIGNASLYKTLSVNGRDFLLVHAGLGSFSLEKQLYKYTENQLLWERPEKTQKYFDNITTILGHTPTHYYGSEYCGKMFSASTWADIDTGAACGGSPMLLRLDDMTEFYI